MHHWRTVIRAGELNLIELSEKLTAAGAFIMALDEASVMVSFLDYKGPVDVYMVSPTGEKYEIDRGVKLKLSDIGWYQVDSLPSDVEEVLR